VEQARLIPTPMKSNPKSKWKSMFLCLSYIFIGAFVPYLLISINATVDWQTRPHIDIIHSPTPE